VLEALPVISVPALRLCPFAWTAHRTSRPDTKICAASAGTPDAPRCGFSRKVAAALQATKHPFGFFDILSDEAVRQARCYLSPSLWTLLGSYVVVDIVKRPVQLVHESPLTNPSYNVANLLSVACRYPLFLTGSEKTPFLHRQGIKEYGQWPTFPQVWVRGELLGGCDIVETLDAEGSLAASIDDMLAA